MSVGGPRRPLHSPSLRASSRLQSCCATGFVTRKLPRGFAARCARSITMSRRYSPRWESRRERRLLPPHYAPVSGPRRARATLPPAAPAATRESGFAHRLRTKDSVPATISHGCSSPYLQCTPLYRAKVRRACAALPPAATAAPTLDTPQHSFAMLAALPAAASSHDPKVVNLNFAPAFEQGGRYGH